MNWTEKDQLAAQTEGWELDPEGFIQRAASSEEEPRFSGDVEAVAHVYRTAQRGDLLSIKAVQLMKEAMHEK